MFYVVNLTIEDVQGGILFRIGDALGEAFTSSAQRITRDGERGLQQQVMEIFFQNQASDPSFYDNNEESVFDKLFINEAAKDALDNAGLRLNPTETVENVPEAVGLMSRMYRFI